MRRLSYAMFLGGVLCFGFVFYTASNEDARRQEPLSADTDSDADASPYIAWERLFCGIAGGVVMIATGIYLYCEPNRKSVLG